MKKSKILIVEDEASIVDALKIKLEKEGFDVITARDGKSGLDTALINKPDLILLDIVMPEMDGLSVLKELRKDEWGKTAKIIILSGLTDAEKVEYAINHGVFDFLVKSDWKIQDVVNIIKTKLKIS